MVPIDAAEAQDNIDSPCDKVAEKSPRQFGCGRHLLSGAGINVNNLLATPIDDAFSEYMPDAKVLEQEARSNKGGA